METAAAKASADFLTLVIGKQNVPEGPFENLTVVVSSNQSNPFMD